MSGYPPIDGTQPCASRDPEWWFRPGHDWQQRQALHICTTCPFQVDCLDYALANDVAGVWGSTTEKDRKRIREELGITPTPLAVSDTDDLGRQLARLDDGTRSGTELARILHITPETVSNHRRRRKAA